MAQTYKIVVATQTVTTVHQFADEGALFAFMNWLTSDENSQDGPWDIQDPPHNTTEKEVLDRPSDNGRVCYSQSVIPVDEETEKQIQYWATVAPAQRGLEA